MDCEEKDEHFEKAPEVGGVSGLPLLFNLLWRVTKHVMAMNRHS